MNPLRPLFILWYGSLRSSDLILDQGRLTTGISLLKMAKFELKFVLGTDFAVNRELKVGLPDGSTIILFKSKHPRGNYGMITFCVDRPDDSYAKHEGQQKVNHFINCMLMVKDNLENLRPPQFPEKPKLLNPDDFKEVIKTSYADVSVSLYIVHSLEQQTLDEAANFDNQIYRLPDEESSIILKSLHWFRKASETDGEERFIFRWISFEQLLELLNKRAHTQNLIPEFIDLFLRTEISRTIFQKHRQIIENLAKTNLVGFEDTPRVRYSEMLGDLIQRSADARAIMPKVMLCIYEVRNRLFHRGEVLELMQDCSSMLREIIRECLKCYLKQTCD